jgi:hypothetical protein
MPTTSAPWWLRGRDEFLAFAVQGNQRLLNEAHFSGLKQRLAALRAHPSWNGIPVDVVAVPINAEGGYTSLHPALAMDTLH